MNITESSKHPKNLRPGDTLLSRNQYGVTLIIKIIETSKITKRVLPPWPWQAMWRFEDQDVELIVEGVGFKC